MATSTTPIYHPNAWANGLYSFSKYDFVRDYLTANPEKDNLVKKVLKAVALIFAAIPILVMATLQKGFVALKNFVVTPAASKKTDTETDKETGKLKEKTV